MIASFQGGLVSFFFLPAFRFGGYLLTISLADMVQSADCCAVIPTVYLIDIRWRLALNPCPAVRFYLPEINFPAPFWRLSSLRYVSLLWCLLPFSSEGYQMLTRWSIRGKTRMQHRCAEVHQSRLPLRILLISQFHLVFGWCLLRGSCLIWAFHISWDSKMISKHLASVKSWIGCSPGICNMASDF